VDNASGVAGKPEDVFLDQQKEIRAMAPNDKPHVI
jgi:hypothetical protein